MMNKTTQKYQHVTRNRILLRALVKRKILEPEKAKSIYINLKDSGHSVLLEDLVIKENLVQESDLLNTLVSIWNVPSVSLSNHIANEEALKLIPALMAEELMIFPLFRINSELFLAMADPKDINTIDKVSQYTGLLIKPAISSGFAIREAIKKYYDIDIFKPKINYLDHLEAIQKIIQSEEAPDYYEDTKNLEKATEAAPVVRMTNMILNQAVIDGASDIHISPEEQQLHIRTRIDGELRNSFNLPKQWQKAIISRIKILAKLDIAEQRIPQDGQFKLLFKDGRKITIRVSTLPINHGEDIVLRILDKDASLLKLENLGLAPKILNRMDALLRNVYGMILVTGPTGSGKTTTLYACLNKLSTGSKKNIITLEDPIEYALPNIRQSQVNVKAGMTFAKGLRSIVRHDPDIILVGEIRDTETANIAIQAALTGHLVLSTLHTNDAISAISRLLEMGIESILLSSALLGVQAQRLIRKTCKKCKEPVSQDLTPFTQQLEALKIQIPDSTQFYRGKGCDECRQTGYSGRTSIMEVFIINKHLQKMISKSVPAEEIREAALEDGMLSMIHDAWSKVIDGTTSIEEIMRILNDTGVYI